MPELVPVFDEKRIASRVAEVARRITADYRGKDLVLLGVLKGAFVFLADLVRHLPIDRVVVDFVRLSSYGKGVDSSGCVKVTAPPTVDLAGKDVLIVEDIFDTGRTLVFLKQYLAELNPGSVRTCVLIDKLERRECDLQADYACFQAKEGFLVGYGLDHAEAYRGVPGIYHLKLKEGD